MYSLKGRKALQRDLNKVEDKTIINHMTFNKAKGQILHLGWGIPGCMYRPGNGILESRDMERDQGPKVLIYSKLNESAMPWQPEGPTMSWGASGKASPPGQERGLSCSALLWCSITLNMTQFGCVKGKEQSSSRVRCSLVR
ncbi:hypothetical protein BTVI_09519 [Pitangus sulphuratus]|nr:hypothetical protein BTVI_09519 [Pitangus sulphuratus]